MSNKLANTNNDEFMLLEDLSQLIDDSKKQVAIQANSTLTLLFWQIGKRVNHFILNNKRAVYGKQVITTISIKLVNSYGRNFEARNLRRMLQFAQQFKDVAIVTTLSTQLSWSHITELLTLQKNGS